MAGAPPSGIPPQLVPGLTSTPGPAPTPGPMMPPDNLSNALSSLKNRQGSATEMVRQCVTMLETVAALDPQMKDRAGAALALLRGPGKPGEKPKSD